MPSVELEAWVPSSNQTLYLANRVTFRSATFSLWAATPSPYHTPMPCTQLPGYASRCHQLSLLLPSRASLLQANPLADLPLSWPHLSLYCFLSHFFHWKCLTLLSLCLLRLGSKVTCFETVKNSSPLLSIIYLSPPPSMQRVILPYICLCVAL